MTGLFISRFPHRVGDESTITDQSTGGEDFLLQEKRLFHSTAIDLLRDADFCVHSKKGRKVCEFKNEKEVTLKSHVKPAKMADMLKLMKLFIVPEEAKQFYHSLAVQVQVTMQKSSTIPFTALSDKFCNQSPPNIKACSDWVLRQ